LPAVCAAQSNLQIYGVLDAALELAKPGNSDTIPRVQSGILLGSRLGFRGSEDLGGGLKAVFVMEHGFNGDTGANTAAQFWNRRSVVGFDNRWGTLLAGRDYNPARFVALSADRMDFGLYGNTQTITRVGGGAGTRIDNALHFTSKNFNGFYMRAALGAGEERSTAPKDIGRFAGITLEYKKDALYAGAGYNTRKDALGPATAPTGSARMEEGGIGVNYDFGRFAVNGGVFFVNGNRADDTTRSWWLGGQVRVGAAGRLMAQYGVTDPDGPGRATTYGLSYRHEMSRRTTLYFTHGKVNNNAHTNYALNTAVPSIAAGGNGGDPTGIAVGIAHRF
jgi:predicted porin